MYFVRPCNEIESPLRLEFHYSYWPDLHSKEKAVILLETSFFTPLHNDFSQLKSPSMSPLLPAPRHHGNTYPFRGHASTKALESCDIPCAVWGEDLLRHFGVPTIIFDHFLLVSNPETAASKLESRGFHRLPPNPRCCFLEELTRKSIRLSWRAKVSSNT